MDKINYYKYMFVIAALWNWVIAVIMILLTIVSPSSTKDFGMKVPPTWFFFHMLYFFVFLFGLFFYVTSRDMEKYHKLASIFVLEKVGVFIIALIYYMMGHFNEGGLLIAIGDLIFGILFLEFLVNFK